MKSMFKKAGIALTLATLMATSSAMAGPRHQVSDELANEAGFIFADLEEMTSEMEGGSYSGSGTYDITWVDVFDDELIDDAFLPGTAVIVLLGDGTADLDLHVYDIAGRELCVSDSHEALEICEIELHQEQELVVRVDNQSENSDSQFLVWTN